jgi:hypothetical protein
VVERRMPRVQSIILPVLREALPGVTIGSWYRDIDYRTFPIINVRRLGGAGPDPKRLDRPVIEMTAYTQESLPATENLYMDAREVLLDMVERQTVTPSGYLHSFTETMGPTPFDSPFEDSWRVQGLIQLGVRPLRNK